MTFISPRRRGRTGRSASALLDACPLDLRGWEWHYLRGLAHKDEGPLTHLTGVHTVAFAPSGRLLASGCQDGSVWFWDLAARKGRPAAERHKDSVRSVAFSPDGRLLASAGDDRLVRLWDPDDGGWSVPCRGTACFQCVAFSPDGRTLAAAGNDGTIKLWGFRQRPAAYARCGGIPAASWLWPSPPTAAAWPPGGSQYRAVTALGTRLNGAESPVYWKDTPRRSAASPSARDGVVLASSRRRRLLRTWDPVSGQPRGVCPTGADRFLTAWPLRLGVYGRGRREPHGLPLAGVPFPGLPAP